MTQNRHNPQLEFRFEPDPRTVKYWAYLCVNTSKGRRFKGPVGRCTWHKAKYLTEEANRIGARYGDVYTLLEEEYTK